MNYRLKNYTSGVAVERTISNIETTLARAGAMAVTKDYKEGRVDALYFKLNLPVNRVVAIRLPVNIEAVYETLRKDVKRPHAGTLDRLRDQAMRTAWKLMQDWVEVQISLIQMQQVDFMQVFMPYVWDGKRTFYAALKDKQFLALPEASSHELSPHH